jgi:putative ABC transport system substrate-binding protein
MASRRSFVAGALALLAAPLAAQEKGAPRVVRVGVLDPLPLAANGANFEQLKKGLREAGYAEGKNLVFEYRASEGRGSRYREYAAELTKLPVDILVARGTVATIHAKTASDAIPIVAIALTDPVDTGLVGSLERPGGNVTGIAVLIRDVETRRVDVLRALAPKAKRIVAMINMGNPAFAIEWKFIDAAAKGFKLEAELLDVRRPRQIPAAFEAAVAHRAEALVVQLGALEPEQRQTVVDLAAKHRLPAIYTARSYVDAGGLVSYGVDFGQLFYRAAYFVDKVLKGAKPAELAMEQPSKFELIINRKTLRALDLVIPPDLLLRSNAII